MADSPCMKEREERIALLKKQSVFHCDSYKLGALVQALGWFD
jgi:hypothetical protein